jgi:hypothetical protein
MPSTMDKAITATTKPPIVSEIKIFFVFDVFLTTSDWSDIPDDVEDLSSNSMSAGVILRTIF